MLDPNLETTETTTATPPAPAEGATSAEEEPQSPEAGESLEQYLREISRWDLLSAEAERSLARKIARGDNEALDELILRNLRLVIYWAKRYRSTGLSLQDLIQEGNIGLMRAAEKFDPRKGTRFSTYASWWIRQALARAICDKQDLIRIPVHMHQKLRRVDRMLENARGRKKTGEIDVERRINASGIVPFKDWEAARRLQQPISLDRRSDPDREGPIEVEDLEAVNPVSELYQGEMRQYVWRLLEQLPPRHRIVIRLRFGMDDGSEHTLESIGRRLKISRERVRQIQSEAIERISRIAAEQDPAYAPIPAIPQQTLSRRRTRKSAPAPAGQERAKQRRTRRR